jgi:predicted RNase H-like nuclease (RuvC/YqgF family)
MDKTVSELFNALPKRTRTIGAAMECQTRIQHLRFEKDRLKKRYQQSVKEINEHIRACDRALARLEKELLEERE